ncbi:TPM domain-containing protein [Microbacterium fluvii]|uniref:TPM domain-containing protein n=1 Tax=Microbacterium fluvii TaxID=415215 RepID=A0ABW2HA31_9MICO|nr:TPM domain-containing protein [Microbacterium fluvii]MCU4671516.1 TPM domain-containing protein [Microbacterium fluvii]
MRARWAGALAAIIVAALAFTSPAAWATAPVALGSGYVTDEVGALTASEASAAQTRLTDLFESTGNDLFVVFVDEFTDPTSSQEWADQVALDNGLGVTQYLLAVATTGRQLYISADSTGPLTDDQLNAIEAEIKPLATAGDWAGMIETAADSFETSSGGSHLDDPGSGSSIGGFLIFVVLAAIAVVVIWLIVRARRRKRGQGQVAGSTPATGLEALGTKELARRAASALVQTDDAVKTSEEELGFAKAQFGDAATADFEKALADAKTGLDQAFSIQQQLDDGTPDSEQQTRAWNVQIIQLLETANRMLDEKAADFDELRKLEHDAPAALTRVQGLRQAAADGIQAATARLAALSGSYAPEALSTVADNPAQAQARIAFADEQLAAAQTAIGATQTGEAAVAIRAAEEAVDQAVLLEKAVDKLASDLAEGEQNARALIADLQGDIAAASALPDPDGRLAAVIASTRQQVDAATANLSGTQKRPLLTLQALQSANTQIDTLVQGVRDAQAQAQRSQQMLGQVMMQAQAQVSTAEDYITSRRGAIGATARTRLAEAGASLVKAQQLQSTDPQQALQYAQRADQLAGQAIQAAQNDVGAFDGGGMFGGSAGGSSGGGGMMGAVLGGIVINSMLSGGGRGGGRGGMLGGGGRSSGGRGGGFSPGSFGGGGTRGRRGGVRF